MSARRKKTGAPEPVPSVPAYVPPPPPDWFTAPSARTCVRPERSMFSGGRRELVYRLITEMRVGHVALAPWQRDSVWTEQQRVQLLDSMIRGISIGAITMWNPPHGTSPGRPFPGCSLEDGALLVADGQQRLTTLLKAASGDLDHWRWNGAEWTTGTGFLTPSMAVKGTMADNIDWYACLTSTIDDPKTIRACIHDLEAISRTDLHMLVLDGPAEHMVETYRRLATTGSPHSVEDLALMERWMEARSGGTGAT